MISATHSTLRPTAELASVVGSAVGRGGGVGGAAPKAYLLSKSLTLTEMAWCLKIPLVIPHGLTSGSNAAVILS